MTLTNTEVVKLPIKMLVGYFVAYLVIHIGIGVGYKAAAKKLKAEPDNENLKGLVKLLDIGVKWFAAVFVLFLLYVFYNM